MRNAMMWLHKVLRVAAPALMALALIVLPAASTAPVAAQASFSVDVWTNKGGQGYGVPGGAFGAAEELVIYIRATHDCYASITIRPEGGEPGTYFDAELQGGATVSMVPRETGTDLTGSWVVEVNAVTVTATVLSSDYVQFTVLPSSGAPSTPGATPPAPSVTFGPDNATALAALIVLKMAEGSLPGELSYDVDGDGEVTVEDARQILRWAVQ